MRCARIEHWRLIAIVFVFLLIVLIIHKRRQVAFQALSFLDRNLDIEDPSAFERLEEIISKSSHPPGIFFTNKYAIDLMMNFLCNVYSFNITDRLIVLSLDDETSIKLNKIWPNLNVIRWKVPALESRFSFASGEYQLFQLLRSKVSAKLAQNGHDFWMLQADTYWSQNLFEVFDTNKVKGDILFDREGSKGLTKRMIAGGHFYVRGNEKTYLFFTEVARQLKSQFITDNNIMCALCTTEGIECGDIPFSLMANWRWHLGENDLPLFMQFDEFSSSKIERMEALGLRFSSRDGTCLHRFPTKLKPETLRELGLPHSWSLLSIRLSHELCEQLAQNIPGFEYILLTKLLPNLAYFVVL